MIGKRKAFSVYVKAIWKSKTSMKVCFLAQAASKGHAPTEVMLKRGNFDFASRCALCLKEEESVDPLTMIFFSLVFGSFLNVGQLGSTF